MKSSIEKIDFPITILPGMKKRELYSFLSDLNRRFKQLDPGNYSFYEEALSLIANSEYRTQFASLIEPAVIARIGSVLINESRETAIIAVLDIIRSSGFLERLREDPIWSDLILRLVCAANYTFPKLFKHRVKYYYSKPLFSR